MARPGTIYFNQEGSTLQLGQSQLVRDQLPPSQLFLSSQHYQSMSSPPTNQLVFSTTVIVIGAGPSGLATAACLTKHSIPYILLEKEDCVASLWKNKSYDRLHLHLSKPYSNLPHFPIPHRFPKYLSRDDFIDYLTDYASHFKISPRFHRHVTLATHEDETGTWRVKARVNSGGDEEEEYVGKFLVVATGEMSDPYVPKVSGLTEFHGKIIHSTQYKSGKEYSGGDKKVLVVGCGNSGMEIALDLANHGVNTSIVIRGSPMHVLTRGSVDLGLKLLKYLSLTTVDTMLVTVNNLIYGDLTKYRIIRPEEGPFSLKNEYGKYPVIDVGTVDKIKSGDIKVLPAIECIKDKEVMFVNGQSCPFDVIIFATGFSRSTHTWLQGDDTLLGEDGLPKQNYPDHWKGKNGLYCAGFARRAIVGHGIDGLNIADHINSLS